MRTRAILLGVIWCLVVSPLSADVIIRGRTETRPGEADVEAARQAQWTMAALSSMLGLSAADEKLGEGVRQYIKGLAPSEPTTEDFVVYISGDRMRMDSGPRTLFITRVGNTSRYEMTMLDKTQGMAIKMGFGVAAIADWATVSNASDVRIDAAGAGPERLGYATQRFTFRFSTSSVPQLRGIGPQMMAPTASTDAPLFSAVTGHSGEMTVAPDMPGLPEVQNFYRLLAAGFGELEKGGYMTGDLLRNLAAMTSHGMPIEVSETTSVTLMLKDMTADPEAAPQHAVSLGTTITTTTISSVEVVAVRPSLLEPTLPPGMQVMDLGGTSPALPGQPEAAPGCDCSCEGFQEYMALARNRTDPQAQSKLMAQAKCATQCMAKWTACRRQN